ncbi:MAG: Stk1 family PASTA domain-containing Ser/Thr kinase [Levilactobacillus sp.]|jgi:serine/threonine-protein kinase|uniref:Stk1 family PASTA domain-containing Ser/Thr kinase n=1 Tax=Levilactobacillus sp. TaxID=2767919 RepID=UPI00258ED6AE|nr:Stk1 family PASTA domain-containing Ser/Thr kinase [Levilactobacillus sp.]MCH4123445.1 Stk1 family PASTA domain-containing Ser/Thr kinase [Levilactobacillus sp.]MCI1552417.1 Stk1 family PASTA domain-containing Ser/Thr kinase [Levilactobacillus sp.]MCI1599503.1 Stk1 family PASTA domain-containing Ser/Thr kinase [Levilactobacillus sp.]MCI1606720.1 Stk1 family PASTA domain-containing Ser/Thr kinase [Levilactobacillus sp.]
MRTGYTLSGRYRIIRALGEGGMANVYLAHDLILDRDVSVKLLRLDLRDDPSTIRRFQREALAATELVNPNIVQVYDVGEENGMQYLVMEYVEGTDLKAYIKAHFPIAYQEVIHIMEQILSAVQTAHEHNIIHRDLKPQNILIDQHKVAKITDFGIAVALSEHSLTQTNTVLGSVHYLSPEQARGGMATKKSDIYSLGIILYELLTGTVPFEGETAVSIALKHFQSEIPSVREIDPRIPQALENVVLKATAKRPEDRYTDAASMAADLKTSLSPKRAGEVKFTPAQDDDGETKVLPLSALSSLTPETAAAATQTTPQEKTATDSAPAKAAGKKGRKKTRHPRRRKFLLAGLVVLLLVAGILIGMALFRPQMTSVPSVAGRTEQVAKSRLTNAYLTVGKVHKTASATVKVHRAVRTEPRSGTQLKRQTVVDLWISTGPKRYQLADYLGDAYASTAAKLEALGFKVHRESVHSTSVPAGRIMQQSVQAGQKVVPAKTDITFTVSTGSETVTLADLTNKTKAQAQSYATNRNLNLAFDYAYSNDVAKGRVIKQSPGEGAVVQEGDEVTLTMSRGVESESSSSVDQFSVNVKIPFDDDSASESSSEDDSDDDSSSSSSSSASNLIQIYLRDQDHSLSTIYKQMTITSDTSVTLPFTVASGKSGAYKVVRDGHVIASDSHVTKN